MGGDHKCSVCNATFTRPQHVARHMRSHTGDRPYKCQYCGDQFARSDLLSRHVNKCHANEKPLPASTNRRKGSASASRATTSKQACDDCVRLSLPCDGCNPCSKCVQRRVRCTFVKYHRQTAPTGPGHNLPTSSTPNLSAASLSSSAPSSSSRFYSRDDLFLDPPHHTQPPNIPDPLRYSSSDFSFPPLYTSSQSQGSASGLSVPGSDPADFTTRFRQHAEILRQTAEQRHRHEQQPPPVQNQALYSQMQQSHDPSSPVTASNWNNPQAWDSHPHARPGSVSGYSDGSGASSFTNEKDHSLSQYISSPPNLSIPSQASRTSNNYVLQPNFSNRRRAMDLGFDTTNTSSGSTTSNSNSAGMHLPLSLDPGVGMDMSTQAYPNPFNHRGSPPTSAASTSTKPQSHEPHPNFHSAFGQLSLDDIDLLSTNDTAPFFSSHPPVDDPNATPMPISFQASMQHSGISFPSSNANTTLPKDNTSTEALWRQFINTPGSTGPGPLGGANTPGYRRPRVASLPSPSIKAPTDRFGGIYGGSGFSPAMKKSVLPPRNDRGSHFGGSTNGANMRRTGANQEDSQSNHTRVPAPPEYQLAVLDRPPLMNLTIGPKARRGTIPSSSATHPAFSATINAVNHNNTNKPAPGDDPTSRPASTGSTSSLANVFGHPLQHSTLPPGLSSIADSSAHLPPTSSTSPRLVGGRRTQSSSPGAISLGVESRESSVAISDISAGSGGSSAEGSSSLADSIPTSGSGMGSASRPSIKRGPSHILEPGSSKRALVAMDVDGGVGAVRVVDVQGQEGNVDIATATAGGGGGGGGGSAGVGGGFVGEGLVSQAAVGRKDERPTVTIAERRRMTGDRQGDQASYNLGLVSLPPP